MRQMPWRTEWLLHFTNMAIIIMTSKAVLWPGTQTSEDVGSLATGNGATAAMVLKLKLYNSYPGSQQ